MALADFIRQERESCMGTVMEPIVEGLSKYLAKELKDKTTAHIHWEYDKEKEQVDESRAWVYYKRKVALLGWLRGQGFHYRDAICHLNGQITGINVYI